MRSRAKILVAEDEPDMLRGIEQALRREAYDVEPAFGGLDAAEKLKAGQFDVVVSDLKMPLVDGMDLLRIAKKMEKEIIFLMITAYGTPESAVEAMKLGSFDYILKPFALGDLVTAIERGLRGRGGATSPGAARRDAACRGKLVVLRSPGEHVWASPQPDGTVLVGADADFFKRASEAVYCDLPLEGDELVRGESCARTIDTTNMVQTHLLAPLSGTVVELNDRMQHDPQENPADPYGEGWLFRIAPSNLQEEVRSLVLEKAREPRRVTEAP